MPPNWTEKIHPNDSTKIWRSHRSHSSMVSVQHDPIDEGRKNPKYSNALITPRKWTRVFSKKGPFWFRKWLVWTIFPWFFQVFLSLVFGRVWLLEGSNWLQGSTEIGLRNWGRSQVTVWYPVGCWQHVQLKLLAKMEFILAKIIIFSEGSLFASNHEGSYLIHPKKKVKVGFSTTSNVA